MEGFQQGLLDGPANVIQTCSKLLNWISAAALGVTTALIILSSLMRYGIGKPFHFTEEVCALFFLSCCIFSMSHGLTNKKHIRITAIFDLIPKPFCHFAEFFAYLVSFVFLLVFIRESWIYAMDTFEYKSVSPDADIPLWPWMAVVPIGTAVFTINMFIIFLQRIQSIVGKDKGGV